MLEDHYLHHNPTRNDVDTLLGFDVNDFTSETTYAIFNDPDALELVGLAEAMKPILLETPLYEDVSLERTVKHAKLMNEDRRRGNVDGALRSPVIVKTQTTLRTPYVVVPLEGI